MPLLTFAFRMLLAASVGWTAKDITESLQETDEVPLKENLTDRAKKYLTVTRWITIAGIAAVIGTATVLKMTKQQRKKLL